MQRCYPGVRRKPPPQEQSAEATGPKGPARTLLKGPAPASSSSHARSKRDACPASAVAVALAFGKR